MKGGDTPIQASYSRGTQRTHYCCYREVTASGPSPRGTSPVPSSVSCITAEAHQFCWLQLLLITRPGSWLHLMASDCGLLTALWLSRCPKTTKICRIPREFLYWSSNHANPIAQPSNSVSVLPHPEMLSIILIPLSSYNSLTLSSHQKLSVMQSTIERKLASCSICVSSVPAALLLSSEYFLLSCSSAISLPTEKARSAEQGGCSSLVGSEILWRSLLHM